MSLNEKRILIGVSGSIAAFKAVELVRTFARRGAVVRVAMTRSAANFVGPTTFTAITGHETATDMWNASYPGEIHVELSHWAEAIVIAPATANLMARTAGGFADDVLTATLLCATCPVYYAPAMHERMWLAASTQRNVVRLRESGAHLIGPVRGLLANGEEGMGRMEEPENIAKAVEQGFLAALDLAGKTVLVTAGPTLEDLDPVRFIGNRSSGRMGFAIAARAAKRGAQVVLISGPVTTTPPPEVKAIQVRSAREMHQLVLKHAAKADAVIMAAAVADYRPKTVQENKIKKRDDSITIELVKNPDILADLGKRRRNGKPVLVGFALETQNLIRNARDKLREKKADLIVANEAAIGLASDHNQATIISRKGAEPLAPMSKLELADYIINRVIKLLKK